jgi:hypothetical protein
LTLTRANDHNPASLQIPIYDSTIDTFRILLGILRIIPLCWFAVFSRQFFRIFAYL